ncbi:MAG: hypothetical protein ACR2HR_03300 [Euzebya sp.]
MPRVFLLLIVLVVAATACAAPSEGRVVQESSDGRFEQVAVEDVLIWRSVQGSGDGLAAEVTGTVGYDVECGAFLHSQEFDLRYPVVWPAGTEIERADPVSIRLPGGSTVEVGEVVSGGGGYHSDVAMFPEGCAESGETAIFNASGDVEVLAAAPGTAEPATAAPVTFDRCADLEEPLPSPDGPLSDDADVAAAQQARAAVALPSDIATVEALLAAGPDGDGWPLGYPHTAEEFDAIMARNGDVDQLGALRQWAASTHPDTWGGLWLDQSRGGLTTVAFTTDVDDRVGDIADRYGLDVRGVEVTFTEAELTRAQDTLILAMRDQYEGRDASGPQPGDLTSSWVHAPTNRLQVGMYTNDEATQRRLTELVDPTMICLNIEEIPTEEDAGPASWAPSADADLSAESTVIALDVIERACASATPAEGRIVVQDIRYEEAAIVVTIGVIPLPGGNDCPGNPITPFTLELDEPLNGRQLLDGASNPPSEPVLDH